AMLDGAPLRRIHFEDWPALSGQRVEVKERARHLSRVARIAAKRKRSTKEVVSTRHSDADSRHSCVIHSVSAIVKNNAPGPAIESFGPHFRISMALIGIGGLFSWLAFDAAKEEPTWIAWAVFYCLAIGFGPLVMRHLALRLWLHEKGISYRGIV